MEKTTAKFVCQSVNHTVSGQNVTLVPVTGNSEENKTFFKWTPSGEIKMGIVNPDVVFEPGKEYLVTFTPATMPSEA